MTVRILQNPWRLLLAINAAVIVGVFIHKIQLPPYVPYIRAGPANSDSSLSGFSA
ncbi:putative Kef-type K+ transport protein [Bradyrhizobium liaoningense]